MTPTLLTAHIPELLKHLEPALLLERLCQDPKIMSHSYILDGKTTLWIFNWSKALHFPETLEQCFAKGMVLAQSEQGVTLVALSYLKFFNAFEEPAETELERIQYDQHTLSRKLDGTLLARWVFEGRVYFSTRGRIINLERNTFWDLTTQVIEAKNYAGLHDPQQYPRATLILELIGPDNTILERYPENDLKLTGIFDLERCAFLRPQDLGKGFPATATEYGTHDARAFVDTFPELFEGVVEKFYLEDQLVYQTKHKSQRYLSLLALQEHISLERMLRTLLEQDINQLEPFLLYLEQSVPSQHLEEIQYLYTQLWESEAKAALEDFFAFEQHLFAEVEQAKTKAPGREQAEFLRSSLGKMGDFAMGILKGKTRRKQVIEVWFKTR